MHCAIYKSSQKLDLYLYVREKDEFSDIPEPLLKSMGKPQFVMELELSPDRTLARADVAQVMQSLEEKGFYVQMPPEKPEF